MKAASHNAIQRSLHSMGFRLENAMHHKRHESDATRLTEIQQQYQLDISGEAGTGAFTEFHVKFSEVFYYAPTQRNNKLEDPQMFWGAVLDEGDVFFTVHVSKWYMDESANYVGCIVRVGAMQAGYQGTGSVAATPFKGTIHVTFQGLGIPLEDPGLDEPTTVAGGLPGQAGDTGAATVGVGSSQEDYIANGGWPVGTAFRSGGELNGYGLVGSPSPTKHAASGPLGSNKTWTAVASFPGSLGDFTILPQVVEAKAAPAPSMQVGTFGKVVTATGSNKVVGSPDVPVTFSIGFRGTVLTTADKHQVEVYDTPNGHPGMHPTAPENQGGSWYHGEKYALIWDAAGSRGGGYKLRAKIVVGTASSTGDIPTTGPILSLGVVLNIKDRHNGLAFFAGAGTPPGFTTDLRKLGTVQEEVGDFTAGQAQEWPPYAAGFGSPSTGTQEGRRLSVPGNDDSGVYTFVEWFEVWRRTDGIVEAAIYEDDPAGGAAPVEHYTFDTTKPPYNTDYGSDKAGKWGFVFNYLDQDEGTGLAEATLFHES